MYPVLRASPVTGHHVSSAGRFCDSSAWNARAPRCCVPALGSHLGSLCGRITECPVSEGTPQGPASPGSIHPCTGVLFNLQIPPCASLAVLSKLSWSSGASGPCPLF